MPPRNIDKLAKVLADVTPEALTKQAIKSTQINLRATPDEKTAMESTAAALGLTLSEYIFALHQYAAARLPIKSAHTQKRGK